MNEHQNPLECPAAIINFLVGAIASASNLSGDCSPEYAQKWFDQYKGIHNKEVAIELMHTIHCFCSNFTAIHEINTLRTPEEIEASMAECAEMMRKFKGKI